MNKTNDDIKLQYALPIYNHQHINEIPDSELQFTISDQLFLETLLMEIRGKSISYGSYIKKETQIIKSKLLTRIKELEENFSNENIEDLENLKSKIQNIQSTQLKGCMIRS